MDSEDEDNLPISAVNKKTKKRVIDDEEDDKPLIGGEASAPKDEKQEEKGSPEKSSSDEKKEQITPNKEKNKEEKKENKKSANKKETKEKPKEEKKDEKKTEKKEIEKKDDKSKKEEKAVEKKEKETPKKEEKEKSKEAEKKDAMEIEKKNGKSSKEDSKEKPKAPAKRKREDSSSPPAAKKAKNSKKEEESSSSSSSSDSEDESSSSESSSGSSSSGSSSSSSESSSSSDEEANSTDDDVPLGEQSKKRKRSTTKSKSPKKTPPKKATTKKTTKKTSKKEKTSSDEKKEPKEKKSRKKKEDEEPEYKWWLEEPLPEGKKWKTLQHNGVLFPPEYEPHGVPLLYDGEEIELSPEQEELATYYSMYIESDHVKKPQFNQNFFKEFLHVLNPKGKKKHKVTELSKCDFSKIRAHILAEREEKKNRSKEEKQKEKEEKDKIQEKYGIALVDGHKEKIANYRVEPPGLFLGRGDHPKSGMLKKRIMPEDVTLNLGKGATVPDCPIKGHSWGKIVHDDEVAWLAMWKDNINDHFKYVWLAPSSRVKGEADLKKFEVARKLKDHIEEIRETYTKELRSKDEKIRQRATALYLIDHLALRVGNEKDEDEADTVGCCSLRVEHIKLDGDNQVEFDFLGKDSMRYQNTVEVDEDVYSNLKSFCKGKKKKDDLFDQLTVTSLNSHLKSMMEGLTAKVFRTYNASICLQNELAKTESKDDDEKRTVDEEYLNYTRANREVAILCNHQKTVSKKHGEQMEKIDEKLKELQDEMAELKDHLSSLKSGKPPKKKKKEESDEDDEKKKKKKTPSDDPEKVAKAITRLKDRIRILENKKIEKDETKTVALTTSKINYLDPRISVAWAKRVGVPIEKIFSKALRLKFPWAMDVDEDWEF